MVNDGITLLAAVLNDYHDDFVLIVHHMQRNKASERISSFIMQYLALDVLLRKDSETRGQGFLSPRPLKHAVIDRDPGAALGRGKRQHIDSVVSIQFTL
jgi:hypothetical protein